jgi:putative peptidoglycan lipid II flippase
MEHSRLIRSAFKIGGFTLLSRFLGLCRDLMTAGYFGTSLAMSAFVVAFRVPNLFRALFGEGALSAAFVPVFVECRRKQGDGPAWLFARKVITLLGSFLLALVLAGIGLISLVLATSALGEKAALILPLTRIMLPYVLFICLAAVAMGILNAYHQFSVPAATPMVLNLTWMAFLWLVCPSFGDALDEQIYGLAWGVFVAGLIQMLFQVPALVRRGYRPGVFLDVRDAMVTRVLRLMAPAALGSAVTQVNVMVNSLLAAWIGAWAPAALFYAERLLYFPQGLLATAVSTVLLPVLSGHAASEKRSEMLAAINHAVRTLLFVMVPAAVGLFVLARPITQMLFERGKFDASSTGLTSVALRFYAPGLMVFCLAKVFVPAFYAMKDTRTPVRVALASVALNFTLNVAFILTWPLYLKHAGLALAMVISESFNGLTLGVLLHRRLGSPGWGQIVTCAGRALAASAAMAAVLLAALPALSAALGGLGLAPKPVQIGSVLGTILAGALTYTAAARLLRAPELGFVSDALRSRRGSGGRGQEAGGRGQGAGDTDPRPPET